MNGGLKDNDSGAQLGQSAKILIITYYWPPSGGPAVQRWLAFTNLLAEKPGMDIHVLTVDENSANYPALDPSLQKQISPKVKVYKTRTAELYWLYKRFIGKGKAPSAGFANEGKPGLLQLAARFIRGNFVLPDGRKNWNKYALAKARDIIQKENISILITAGPPHSTHLIGRQLKKEYGLPWIADFHDAWTDVWYYDKLMHTALAKKYDLGLERKVLEEADRVFTVGKLLKNTLAAKLSAIDAGKIEVISMGYDESLFTKASHPPHDAFVITYTGTIDSHYRPEILFRAVKKIKAQYPDIKYKLRFIGLLDEEIKKQAESIGVAEDMEVMGYMPHERSIEYLFNSTVLLLVSPQVRSEEIIIPGKIYEYLAARKPVINIGSLNCDSARIISESEAGANFDRDMEQELTNYLAGLSQKWLQDPDLDLKNNNTNYVKYSRKNEAETVYSVILQIIDDQRQASRRKQ